MALEPIVKNCSHCHFPDLPVYHYRVRHTLQFQRTRSKDLIFVFLRQTLKHTPKRSEV